MNRNQLARFFGKIVVNPQSGCWEWIAYVDRAGYSRFNINGVTDRGHLVAYRAFVGPVPEGLEIDHTCHNADSCEGLKTCKHRRCVNPAHLEAVSHKINIQRGVFPKTRPQSPLCPKGHQREWREWPTGKRQICPSCINERSAKYYNADKAKHKRFQDRWNAEHKEERNAYIRRWRAERRAKGLPVS